MTTENQEKEQAQNVLRRQRIQPVFLLVLRLNEVLSRFLDNQLVLADQL